MTVLELVLLLYLSITSVTAAPAALTLLNRAPCTTIAQRKAWHTFTTDEKLDYINAELCLMSKPAKLQLKGVKTRFDDFQGIHVWQAYANHFVGAFLPFHRLLLWTHEQALRNECNYKGYQPYWHEPIDAGKFKKSVVLDPVYGFGGDGSGTQGCIKDGPFKNYTNALGPGYDVTNHCINRQITEVMSTGSSQANVDTCLAATSYATVWPCIEGSPHGGGHGGVGGQMVNGASSPGDPLFYLHHTWLDKLWWNWQQKDKTKRLTDISGANVMSAIASFGFPPRPASIPAPTGAAGDPGTTTTLTHVLNMYGETANRTIADVMDTSSGFLCYEYVEPN